MTESPSSCPHCGQRVNIGTFTTNQLLSADKITAINLVHGESRGHACNKCGDEAAQTARARIEREMTKLQSRLAEQVQSIPIVSIHSPCDWTYRTIGLVTAQSTLGTGLFSDVTSAFTDLFGVQSSAYNRKLREGENFCRNLLRLEALDLGGNAVLATDIDFAEVGGQRAMLMVCMAGTAVELHDESLDGLNEDLNASKDTLRKLKSFQALKLDT